MSKAAKGNRTAVANAATNNVQPKGKRVTIDLTPAATQEIDEWCDLTGLKIVDVFRASLTLFRHYIDTKKEQKQLQIYDPKNNERMRLELPMPNPM